MDNLMTKPDIGKTTISQDVLHTISRLTTLRVQGVIRMASHGVDLEKLFGGESDGVRVKIIADKVFVDIYVILSNDVNVRDVSRNIQAHVSRAISEMVGMDVGGVNVHIMDVEFHV
jgi:uncharacterized alkaline shock family protein YloU